MEMKATLKKTLSVMNSKGFCKGALAENDQGSLQSPTHYDTTRVCIEGAVHLAVGDVDAVYIPDVLERLRSYVPKEFQHKHGFDRLIQYNDDEATTKKDIINLIKRAINGTT